MGATYTGRDAAVRAAGVWFDRGELAIVQARRVTCRTESQRDDARADLRAYPHDEIAPSISTGVFRAKGDPG
jgi:Zn-finger nucleic acid-binding protein